MKRLVEISSTYFSKGLIIKYLKGGGFMAISYEFFFQILNILLWILIAIAIYGFIKTHRKNKELVNSRISNLEKKVDNLESR